MDKDYTESPQSPVTWKRGPARSKPKHKFTEADDMNLKKIVQEIGVSDWEKVAKRMKNRNSRQCKERWMNYLSPEINTTPWTQEEDNLLMEAQSEMGSKWVQIAKLFKGRTDSNVKNRWQMLDRKVKKENNIFLKRKKVIKEVKEIPVPYEEYINIEEFKPDILPEKPEFFDQNSLRVYDIGKLPEDIWFLHEFIL